MRNFIDKIKDVLELKYEHLRGLNGLLARDIKRITGIDINKGGSSVSRALKNPISTIPTHGLVSENLKANDHLMCDVDSEDIWVKVRLMIEAELDHYVEAELEVKVDKSMHAEAFQRVLQKLILQIWDQYVTDVR